MIKAIKVKLKPNNKERTMLNATAGSARWAYNYALNRVEEHYKQTGKTLSNNEIRKEITLLKQTEKFKWLFEYSNNVPKQAVKDLHKAFNKFFCEKKKNGKLELLTSVKKKLQRGEIKREELTIKDYKYYPRFKSKKKSKPGFYQDVKKIKFKSDRVLIEKIGWVKLTEKNRIPVKSKYLNPRVTYDGIEWFVSVGIESKTYIERLKDVLCNLNKNGKHPNWAKSITKRLEEEKEKEKLKKKEGIGIDVGIKDLAIVSTGEKFKNINKKARIKNIKKKLKRTQRRVSKKYGNNKIIKEGGETVYIKTRNIIKYEHQIKKLNIRLTNIRTDYLHKITTKLVKTKPLFIVIEDLNISGMMKNKHLAKAVQEQKLYEFKRQLKYKTEPNEIELIEANRWFPSSKTCNICGNIKHDLKLKDRIYRCSCGYIADRDINASLNLRDYGLAKQAF